MSASEIYVALTEIFEDVFMRDNMSLAPHMSAKDVIGWDSFKQIEIILAVEEKYGIKFHTRDVDKLNTVADLAHAVAAKL